MRFSFAAAAWRQSLDRRSDARIDGYLGSTMALSTPLSAPRSPLYIGPGGGLVLCSLHPVSRPMLFGAKGELILA